MNGLEQYSEVQNDEKFRKLYNPSSKLGCCVKSHKSILFPVKKISDVKTENLQFHWKYLLILTLMAATHLKVGTDEKQMEGMSVN